MALRIGQIPAQRKQAFPPSVDAGTRLLVLGSLPGDTSIRHGEYYAHRGNAFWWLMEAVLDVPLRGQPYAFRLKTLKSRGVGLWDVMEAADREGSLDSAIRAPELRDLAHFAAALPQLQAVAFNGKAAATHGRRQLGDATGLALIDLPSSSGAHASLSREGKREAWIALRKWIA